MLHILGVNLPDQKVVSVALTYFYGIGKSTSERDLLTAEHSPTMQII